MTLLLDLLAPPLVVTLIEGAAVGRYVVDGLPTCRRGHVQTEATVYVSPAGRRYCRTCRRSYMAGYRQDQRRPFRPERCIRGHEFTDDNTTWIGTRRQCRACRKERATRPARSKKEQQMVMNANFTQGPGLDEDRLQRLGTLEQQQALSQWERGTLAGMRRQANPVQQERIDRLLERQRH